MITKVNESLLQGKLCDFYDFYDLHDSSGLCDFPYICPLNSEL
jgi:hypothetical protein